VPSSTSNRQARCLPGCVGVGTAYGTFGELLQGALPVASPDNHEGRFLVTLPVARWSRARFEVHPTNSDISVKPFHKTKALRLARSLVRDAGVRVAGELTIETSIPEGKGLASSSADLVATARAVAAALRIEVPNGKIGLLLAEIEPTDGVMHEGSVAFDHRKGVLLRSLGNLPSLQIVAVDQGGSVDTVAFNKTSASFSRSERSAYLKMLDELDYAVQVQDLRTVGQIATRSATLNQSRLPNRNLQSLISISRNLDGLGLVACHSGTMVGLLLDPRESNYQAKLADAVQFADDLPGQTHLYRTLGG